MNPRPDPTRPLSPDQIKGAAARWRAGQTTADIARHLGVHEAAVERDLPAIKRVAKWRVA